MMTESDLYCMAMESQTAYRHMEELCYRLGYEFPPRLEYPAVREALADPFSTTTKQSHETHSGSIC
jgi:hypothetical protein